MREPLPARVASADEGWALFDRLDPVALEELQGAWHGGGLHSGHPLDGLLEAVGWWGKRFDSPDDVQPLVVTTIAGTHAVRPFGAHAGIRLAQRWPSLKRWGGLARIGLVMLRTHRPQARVRLVQHRGVATAAVVYDTVPIVDVLRRADASALLGAMDCRGVPQPLFFTLRQRPSPSGSSSSGGKVGRQSFS